MAPFSLGRSKTFQKTRKIHPKKKNSPLPSPKKKKPPKKTFQKKTCTTQKTLPQKKKAPSLLLLQRRKLEKWECPFGEAGALRHGPVGLDVGEDQNPPSPGGMCVLRRFVQNSAGLSSPAPSPATSPATSKKTCPPKKNFPKTKNIRKTCSSPTKRPPLLSPPFRPKKK